MIKALGSWGDGRDLVLLGLSHENVARLFADEPIQVDLSAPPPVGLALKDWPVVVILAGSTEESMLAALQKAGLAPPHVHREAE